MPGGGFHHCLKVVASSQLMFTDTVYVLTSLTPAELFFHPLLGTGLPSLGSKAVCQDRP
jgi:hypothetical protein